jgi:hypothetical protein
MFTRGLLAIAFAMLCASGAHAAVTIAFYAHHLGSKGLWVEFPHAYVTLNGTTEVGALAVKGNFGFTPPVVGPDVLFGWVYGVVIGADDEYVAKDTASFSMPLTDKQYATVLAVAERWRNYPQPSYEIDKRNCVLFVKDVAASLGLAVSDDTKFVRDPAAFMADLKARNADLIALANAPGTELAVKAAVPVAAVTHRTAAVHSAVISH